MEDNLDFKENTNNQVKSNLKSSSIDIISLRIILTVIVAIFGILFLFVINSEFDVAETSTSNANKIADSNLIDAYNSRYEQFFGDNIKASDVRSLIYGIRAHYDNLEEVDRYGSIYLYYYGINSEDDLFYDGTSEAVFNKLLNKIKNFSKYTIEPVSYYDNCGIICRIRIIEMGSDGIENNRTIVNKAYNDYLENAFVTYSTVNNDNNNHRLNLLFNCVIIIIMCIFYIGNNIAILSIKMYKKFDLKVDTIYSVILGFPIIWRLLRLIIKHLSELEILVSSILLMIVIILFIAIIKFIKSYKKFKNENIVYNGLLILPLLFIATGILEFFIN